MQAKFSLLIIIACFICGWQTAFGQTNQDSLLLVGSERWHVDQNKGVFGLAKPQFGPYNTVNVGKHEAPVLKNKTTDGKEMDYAITGEGASLDIDKLKTIEKVKFYKLTLAAGADTTAALFSITSISNEKHPSFISKMLDNKNEKQVVVLRYNRDVSGKIITNADSMQWTFFIDNYSSGGRQTAASSAPNTSMSGGYLKNSADSIYIQIYASFDTDLILVNAAGEHVASLKYRYKPAYVWIRKDLKPSYQQALAALFAVIIAIRDL